MTCFTQTISQRVAAALLIIGVCAGPVLAQSGQPPEVRVANPIAQRVVDWDEYTGRFQATQSVDVQARVTGYLDDIHFQEGALVQAGDLLYTVDQRPFRLALRQAEAQLMAAEAARDLARIEFERAQELVERNVGRQAEEQRTSAVFQQSLADVLLAEAGVDQAKLDLEFSAITAPITGRISSSNLDVGDLVVGGAGSTAALATIVSLDPIEFVFTASEADYLKYARLNQQGTRPSSRDNANPIFVRLLDEEGWTREGEMDFVDNALDTNSGTILGRGVFDNADEFLQPGLFGRARLIGSGEFDALLLPDEAVVADQARSIVYVVGADDVVEIKVVEIGELWDGMRIVRSGITQDDLVVIAGVQRARPGQPVTPIMEDISTQLAE